MFQTAILRRIPVYTTGTGRAAQVSECGAEGPAPMLQMVFHPVGSREWLLRYVKWLNLCTTLAG